MKNLIIVFLICLFSACVDRNDQDDINSYIVETVVHLQPNKTNEVLELFKSTNPKLVSNEPSWISASFSILEEKNIVIVRARWRDKDSYLKFSSSEKFKKTMKQFNKYFIKKPEVTISKILFEM